MPAKKKIAEEVTDLMSTGAEPIAPPYAGLRPVTTEDLAADAEYIAELDADGGP